MKNKIKTFFKFFIPFGIWCFLFKPIFLREAFIGFETLHIYAVVKFYVDNVKLGVFPLWDPFVMWGAPTQILLNYVGIFNPLWFLTIIFNTLGLSFYPSFLYTISVYFWIGQLGFYLLAKIILKDGRAAYIAFLLFLFSTISLSMFGQFHTPLIYIPAIWFFYFLISFFKKPSCLMLAGLIFAASLILTSYLPFYFLTVFIISAAGTLFFNFPAIKTVFTPIAEFIYRRVTLVVFFFGVLVLAVIPGYQAYQSTVSNQVVAPFRNGAGQKNVGVDFMDYEKVSKIGFASRMDIEDLYANLDSIQYGDDCFFYVSLFVYIVLILGAVLSMTKVLAVCLGAALILFLLMMSSGAGLHRLAFDHVVYFKLIRNMHFFLPFFLGVLTLFVSEQIRILFEKRKVIIEKYRISFFVFLVLVHLGLAGFLGSQKNIIVSSFLALGLSFLFWSVFVFDKKRKNEALLVALLFLSIVVQPFEVIWRHNQSGRRASSYTSYMSKESTVDCLAVSSVKPVFVYTRMNLAQATSSDNAEISRIKMTDATRFYENGFPTFWSYELTVKVPFDDLQKYTANKFYIYDAVDILRNIGNFQDLANSFRTERNVAFVAPGESVEQLSGLMTKIPAALLKPVSIVRGPSDLFKVLSFDVNSIKIQTHFPDEKFLVYTDSYHKDWKALINGKPAVIYRANMAFKGIYLPPGVNEIDLQYRPADVLFSSVWLAIVLVFLLIYLLWLRIKEK